MAAAIGADRPAVSCPPGCPRLFAPEARPRASLCVPSEVDGFDGCSGGGVDSGSSCSGCNGESDGDACCGDCLWAAREMYGDPRTMGDGAVEDEMSVDGAEGEGAMFVRTAQGCFENKFSSPQLCEGGEGGEAEGLSAESVGMVGARARGRGWACRCQLIRWRR